MLLSLLAGNVASGQVELVRDGRPTADIVVSSKALSSVRLAAGDLQKHLELMSGARLAIVHAPTAGVTNHVYVGESDFTRQLGATVSDLKAEGFRIIAKDNHVILIGRDEQRQPFPYGGADGLKRWREFAGEDYGLPAISPGMGAVFNEAAGLFSTDATATFYASSELLEQLGVRWYMPYEDGTVIPQRHTVVIPDQTLQKEPVFPYRDSCFYGTMRVDLAGFLWFKRLKYGASYAYHMNHTTWDVVGPEEQKQKHPEYYAIANGKPIAGMGGLGVPRLSDPGFRQSSVRYLDKVLDAYPTLMGASVGMPDGFTQIDERDAALWSRPGGNHTGKFSDYVWEYWTYVANELKKTHPSKYLNCNAYSTYLEPPTQIKELPDNVTVIMACNTANDLVLPSRKQFEAFRAQWLAMLPSKKLFVGDYYLYYRPGSPRWPVFFTKLLQEDMRALRGVCQGKFIEVAPVQNADKKWTLSCPGLTHMLHYWQGKLYWDPDMDRARMLQEYYDLYFGPARVEMKEFYEFAEAVWMRPQSRSVTMFSGFIKPPDVDRYFDILARARQKAGQGTVYDRRIAQIETEMQPLKSLFADLKRSGPDFGGVIADVPLTADGDLTKPFWTSDSTWYAMRDLVSGGAMVAEKSTQVAFRMTPDRSALVIGVNCAEPAMDKVLAHARYPDDLDIFEDDVLEIYLETPERSYFKIVVNAAGKVWDETRDVTLVERDTLPTLWNPGTRAVVKQGKDRWTVEILIPTKDFGSLGPDATHPWGINVCRTRRAGGEPECSAISPTGRMLFAVLSKLGNLQMRSRQVDRDN